jgi:hypothetical protein
MVVNFRARGISRGARKLARTPTLNLKKKKLNNGSFYLFNNLFINKAICVFTIN